MRVLIIGGTRFIGPEVVRQLHALGHQVTVFHRGHTQTSLPSGVQHIFGNRKYLYHFWDEVKNTSPDVVLDMIPITERDAITLMSTFEGLAQRVVVISSQDVYRAYGVLHRSEPGPIEPMPIFEDSPLRTVLYPYRGKTRRGQDDAKKYLDDYEKILVERMVMENANLPGTILRLPMVYGPNDYQHRLHEYVKRMEDERPVIFLQEDLARCRWTRGYVDNIAKAITLAVTDERAAGGIYNVGEEEALSMIEWVEKIGKLAGWHGEVIALSDVLLPAYLVPEINTTQHLVVNSSCIRDELGYKEDLPLDAGLVRTYIWERENPPDHFDTNKFDYQVEDELWSLVRTF
jgi:nucleoside-diphosphate-sugar epimerase